MKIGPVTIEVGWTPTATLTYAWVVALAFFQPSITIVTPGQHGWTTHEVVRVTAALIAVACIVYLHATHGVESSQDDQPE